MLQHFFLTLRRRPERSTSLFKVTPVSRSEAFRKETTAKGIWGVLEKRHTYKGLTNKLFLTRKFVTS